MVKGLFPAIGLLNNNTLIGGVIAILLFSAVVPASAMGVTGGVFKAEVNPGEKISHQIILTSGEDDSPLDFVAEIKDIEQSPVGPYLSTTSENGDNPYSAKEFLTLSTTSFHLEPDSSQTLVLEGTVPSDGIASKYARVDIISLPSDDEGESDVETTLGYSAIVFLTIAGVEQIKTGEIEKVEVGNLGSERAIGALGATMLFKNTGNYHYNVLIDGALKDENGDVLTTFSQPLSFFYILPGNTLEFRIPFGLEEELPTGTYYVETTVSLEDGTVLDSDETKFEV